MRVVREVAKERTEERADMSRGRMEYFWDERERTESSEVALGGERRVKRAVWGTGEAARARARERPRRPFEPRVVGIVRG